MAWRRTKHAGNCAHSNTDAEDMVCTSAFRVATEKVGTHHRIPVCGATASVSPDGPTP